MNFKDKLLNLTEEEFLELFDTLTRVRATISSYNHIFFEEETKVPLEVKQIIINYGLFSVLPVFYENHTKTELDKVFWLRQWKNDEFMDFFSEVELDLLDSLLDNDSKEIKCRLIYDYTFKMCR
jgi:hypothetical protein